MILTAVSLTLLLWGCSADETIQTNGGALTNDSTIRFAVTTDAVSDVVTRGETFDTTEDFETEGRQFTVSAYDYRDDIGEQLMIGTKEGQTINGATVTFDGSGWTTADHYYWPPMSHTVHFYAAYPVAPLTKTANDVAVLVDADTEDDPMTAYLDMGRTAARDYNYAAPLHFRHALTKLNVKAETSVSGWKLTVNKVSIHNLHTKGIVGIHHSTVSPTAMSMAGTEGTPGTAFRTFTVTDNQSDDQIVLPQQHEAWHPEFYSIADNNRLADTASIGTYLAIECALWDDKYKSGAGGYRIGEGTKENITAYGTIYCPVAPAWMPNTRYQYILNFKEPGYGTSAFKDTGEPIYDVAHVTLTANQIENWSDGGSKEIHVK